MSQCKQEKGLFQIGKPSLLPKNKCVLCNLKGSTSCIECHTFCSCLNYQNDQTHRFSQSFQNGIFCSRKNCFATTTFIEYTVTIVFCIISQEIFYFLTFAFMTPYFGKFHVISYYFKDLLNPMEIIWNNKNFQDRGLRCH